MLKIDATNSKLVSNLKFKNFTVVALLGATTFLNAETSAFDAGNIDSGSSYGLTENEQVLRDNRKRISEMQSSVDNTRESVEGLRTVLEGTNSQISKLESRVADLEIRATGKSQGSSELDQMKRDIATIKAQIAEINKKLGSGGSVKKNAELDAATAPASAKTDSDFKSKDQASVLKEADALYAKKDYSGAKERYTYLVSKNYKPAKANYMLGEISYFSGSYAEAINYYKKSISHNESQDYTPKLLYHTAISFDKIGDKDSADKFYKALKASYPDSKEAKAAPTR